MKFVQDYDPAIQSINAYDNQSIRIGNRVFTNSILVSTNQVIENMLPRQFNELTQTHFNHMLELKHDIIIIGTGPIICFLPPKINVLFAQHHTGIEIMTTAAACRTYNILLSEGRNVLAALLVTPEN